MLIKIDIIKKNVKMNICFQYSSLWNYNSFALMYQNTNYRLKTVYLDITILMLNQAAYNFIIWLKIGLVRLQKA